MMGHRSIYHDGWRAVCPWPGTSFTEAGAFFGAPIDKDKLTELDAKGWELYHVDKDFAENHNLAAENRPKLIEMIAHAGTSRRANTTCCQWTAAARSGSRIRARRLPKIARATGYYPHTQAVPINACPNVLNLLFSISADVDVPKGGAEGALFSACDAQGGFCLYVQGGRLHYVYNYVSSEFYHAESNADIPEGRHTLRLEFEVTGKPDIKSGKGAPGRAQLDIDKKLVGQVDVPLTMPLSLGLGGGFVCGADAGSPVWNRNTSPFEFTGTIHGVTVDVSGDLITDEEQVAKMVMARQ